MPRGDRTGPMGFGPMTGRGAGYCAGFGMPGFMNPVGGQGFWARWRPRVAALVLRHGPAGLGTGWMGPAGVGSGAVSVRGARSAGSH